MKASASANAAASQPEAPYDSPPQPRTWATYLHRCSGLLFFRGLGAALQPARLHSGGGDAGGGCYDVASEARGLGAAASQPVAAAPSCSPKPLLIKSPVHTARVGLLLDMFPRARFVYIHRHPLQVWGFCVKNQP